MAAQLVVESVMPGLCTVVPGIDPATGAGVVLTTYRGTILVRRHTGICR